MVRASPGSHGGQIYSFWWQRGDPLRCQDFPRIPKRVSCGQTVSLIDAEAAAMTPSSFHLWSECLQWVEPEDSPVPGGAAVVRLVHMFFFSHTFCTHAHFHVGLAYQQFPTAGCWVDPVEAHVVLWKNESFYKQVVVLGHFLVNCKLASN